MIRVSVYLGLKRVCALLRPASTPRWAATAFYGRTAHGTQHRSTGLRGCKLRLHASCRIPIIYMRVSDILITGMASRPPKRTLRLIKRVMGPQASGLSRNLLG